MAERAMGLVASAFGDAAHNPEAWRPPAPPEGEPGIELDSREGGGDSQSNPDGTLTTGPHNEVTCERHSS